MKVWEKIATFNDTKDWDKESIIAQAYTLKYCPADMEQNHNFIGERRMNKFCNRDKAIIGCGVTCLEEYMDLKVNNKKDSLQSY